MHLQVDGRTFTSSIHSPCINRKITAQQWFLPFSFPPLLGRDTAGDSVLVSNYSWGVCLRSCVLANYETYATEVCVRSWIALTTGVSRETNKFRFTIGYDRRVSSRRFFLSISNEKRALDRRNIPSNETNDVVRFDSPTQRTYNVAQGIFFARPFTKITSVRLVPVLSSKVSSVPRKRYTRCNKWQSANTTSKRSYGVCNSFYVARVSIDVR